MFNYLQSAIMKSTFTSLSKILLLVVVSVSLSNAQTAAYLLAGNYQFSGFSSGTTTTYPTYTTVGSYSTSIGTGISYTPTTTTTTLTLYANTTSISANTTRNEILNGISLAGDGAKMQSAYIVNINTSKVDSVTISFTCSQLTNVANYANSLRLQYRTDLTSNFQDVIIGGQTVTYSSGLATTNGAQTFSNLLLPSNLWNLPFVQLRWIYYRSGGNAMSIPNQRDRIRLDDINIHGKPKLSMLMCGGTMVHGRDTLWSDSIPSNENIYDYWIKGGKVDYIVTGRMRPYFFMTGIPASAGGIQYNTPYEVKVRVNGGNWGNLCIINTPPTIPATKIADVSCNTNVATISNIFLCDWVPFATGYEYHVTGTGVDATYIRSSSTSFALSYVSPGLGANGPQPGRTYAIEVRAIIAGTDKNPTYGSSCNITVDPVVQMVKIRDTECNISITTWGKAFRTTTLLYAVNYDIQLTDMSDNPIATITDTDGLFYFNSLKAVASPALTNSTQYKLRVRAHTQDLVGDYGPACTV